MNDVVYLVKRISAKDAMGLRRPVTSEVASSSLVHPATKLQLSPPNGLSFFLAGRCFPQKVAKKWLRMSTVDEWFEVQATVPPASFRHVRDRCDRCDGNAGMPLSTRAKTLSGLINDGHSHHAFPKTSM